LFNLSGASDFFVLLGSSLCDRTAEVSKALNGNGLCRILATFYLEKNYYQDTSQRVVVGVKANYTGLIAYCPCWAGTGSSFCAYSGLGRWSLDV